MAQDRVTKPYQIVLIGGSTGSIDVLLELMAMLHLPLSFALIIVVHRKNIADSNLASLLSVKTRIPVKEVDDKDILQPGHAYLAPADYHLLLEQNGTFSLDDSEKVNFSRPSIDVTFESAADVYGSALVGILVSGANADGTEGLRTIQQAGGIIVVQHPDSAQIAIMPQQALAALSVDYIFDVPALATFINNLNKLER